jgi:hypothetical protein
VFDAVAELTRPSILDPLHLPTRWNSQSPNWPISLPERQRKEIRQHPISPALLFPKHNRDHPSLSSVEHVVPQYAIDDRHIYEWHCNVYDRGSGMGRCGVERVGFERQKLWEKQEEFEKEEKAIARSESIVHEKMRKLSRGAVVNVKVAKEDHPTLKLTNVTQNPRGRHQHQSDQQIRWDPIDDLHIRRSLLGSKYALMEIMSMKWVTKIRERALERVLAQDRAWFNWYSPNDKQTTHSVSRSHPSLLSSWLSNPDSHPSPKHATKLPEKASAKPTMTRSNMRTPCVLWAEEGSGLLMRGCLSTVWKTR